jgi:8-oxo-dGTP pyrophosphatase MutT (NUDIX family)
VNDKSDIDIIYPQSAVIPFQITNKGLQILLITSLKSKQWIFPKGIVEEHLTPQQSALQEAYEEAGIEGEIVNISLGEYSYPKWGGICEVVVFPMYVTRKLDIWPEVDQRRRKWVSIDDALNLISKEELKTLLEAFKKNIKRIKSDIKSIT